MQTGYTIEEIVGPSTCYGCCFDEEGVCIAPSYPWANACYDNNIIYKEIFVKSNPGLLIKPIDVLLSEIKEPQTIKGLMEKNAGQWPTR